MYLCCLQYILECVALRIMDRPKVRYSMCFSMYYLPLLGWIVTVTTHMPLLPPVGGLQSSPPVYCKFRQGEWGLCLQNWKVIKMSSPYHPRAGYDVQSGRVRPMGRNHGIIRRFTTNMLVLRSTFVGHSYGLYVNLFVLPYFIAQAMHHLKTDTEV